jgi:mannose-6-phosphate isomerase
MWMGTHPELPSYVLSTGENLQDVLNDHAHDLIGRALIQKLGHKDLYFLLKILSIAKALPLQLHPNKDLASKLHTRDPQTFTDPNHKPKIAVALGQFEAFCGFKPLSRISALMDLAPLRQFLPAIKKPDFDDQSLKHVVHAMLSASDTVIASVGTELQSLSPESFGEDTYIPALLPRLWNQYDKSDPGTLVALITMNYVRLSAGQALFIPADGIHAYLSGDVIECMARSNNVLKTGFCPRAERDNVDLFCGCLTFTPHSMQEAMLEPQRFEACEKTKVYSPPLSEFDLLWTSLASGERGRIRAIGGPSILINVKGEGKMVTEGKEYELGEGATFFVGQGVEMEVVAGSGLEVYRAFVE